MKKYILPFAFLALLLSCKSENDVGGNGKGVSNAPSVTVGTDHLSAISVVLKGKANLSKTIATDWVIGFQYSLSSGIMPTNSIEVEAEDADSDYNYTTSITGLTPETTYYYRSFIRENGQDTYGETKSFTTKGVDSFLETLDASDIGAWYATLNASLDLTDIKYKTIVRGFVWKDSEEGEYNYSDWYGDFDYYYYGNYCGSQIVVDAKSFSWLCEEFSHNTKFWYKAYVKIDGQTFSGSEKTFTTGIVPVENISLNLTEHTFDLIGNTITLKATITPTYATDRSIEWESDHPEVAEVNNSGMVWAIDNGIATITATTNDGGKTASCKITVDKYVTSPYTATPGEAVDLGLSVKWSSCNLGASSPEDYGDYFAWGEIEPYYINGHSRDWQERYWRDRADHPISGYNWVSYKWCDGDEHRLIKYCTESSFGTVDDKTSFADYDYEDDAARMVTDGSWRIPSYEDWSELRNNCTWRWTSNYNETGIKGSIVTASNGKSIFLPRTGYRCDDRIVIGDEGFYWTSSLDTESPKDAWGVNLVSGYFRRDGYNRYYGLAIRPVCE